MLIALVLVAVVLIVLENSSQASTSGAGDTAPEPTGGSGGSTAVDSNQIQPGPAPELDPNAPMNTSSITKPSLSDWANAIFSVESGGDPNSLAYRNNNPGNLKYSSALTGPGYVEQGATAGEAGFAAFPTLEDGFNALVQQLGIMFSRNPNQTLTQAMATYAPASDRNDPAAYANTVANKLGVSADSKLSDIFSVGSAAPQKAGG